jgi:hypothetical protein
MTATPGREPLVRPGRGPADQPWASTDGMESVITRSLHEIMKDVNEKRNAMEIAAAEERLVTEQSNREIEDKIKAKFTEFCKGLATDISDIIARHTFQQRNTSLIPLFTVYILEKPKNGHGRNFP